MGARGLLSQWILGNPPPHCHGSDQLRSARPVGTLLGLTPSPLLAFFRSLLPLVPTLLPMVSWTRSCLTPPSRQQASADELTLPPFQQDHAFAAFEQGDWLAELDLLQLGQALQRTAISRGGYDGRSFDVMVAIADVLEADHGWSFEQSDAWLERMGLWEEEF